MIDKPNCKTCDQDCERSETYGNACLYHQDARGWLMRNVIEELYQLAYNAHCHSDYKTSQANYNAISLIKKGVGGEMKDKLTNDILKEKKIIYKCGDNCKGECSGEVDGIIRCPVSDYSCSDLILAETTDGLILAVGDDMFTIDDDMRKDLRKYLMKDVIEKLEGEKLDAEYGIASAYENAIVIIRGDE